MLREGVAGVELDCLSKHLHSPREVAFYFEGAAEVVVGNDVTRVQLDDLVELCLGSRHVRIGK